MWFSLSVTRLMLLMVRNPALGTRVAGQSNYSWTRSEPAPAPAGKVGNSGFSEQPEKR